ncbi:hypothetical protein [Adhaeribacter aquaticus]|uniref:hypothetical protein n=1 Tax=Adhaeribacter aquaticus TaxID=299567 RepID=UPI00040FFBB4|nr:hypothetical protein [Adhaeribacter aquaticus]
MTEITLPEWVTWEQFGCYSPQYFDTFIKGRALKVTGKYFKTYTIEDEAGEQWNIDEAYLLSKKEAERLSHPWRDEEFAFELTYEQSKIISDMKLALQAKSLAKDELRARLISLYRQAFDAGSMSEQEFNLLTANTNFALVDDLQANIRIFEELQNKVA